MGYTKHICSILLLASLLMGCGPKITYAPLQITPIASINLASCLTQTEKPDVQCACFYEDTLRDFIFMVVDESKDTMRTYGMKYDIDSYFKKTSDALCKQLQNGFVARVYADTINNNISRVGTIKGGPTDQKLIYKLSVIESKNHFYQVIFAMTENAENFYRPVCETMLLSFKETE